MIKISLTLLFYISLYIYGIEKEYRLSKVSKVSSAMYGQNEINILYADALASFELANTNNLEGEKAKPQIESNSFDLLMQIRLIL